MIRRRRHAATAAESDHKTVHRRSTDRDTRRCAACLISSATKPITTSLVDLLEMAASGEAPSGDYVGGGGLAPFHDFEDDVPQEVKDLLDEVRAGLLDGSISTGYGE